MKITVEHEVPCDKGREKTCLYDRTHGRKAPVERQFPKCTLCDEWIPGEYQRCKQCIVATQKGLEVLNDETD